MPNGWGSYDFSEEAELTNKDLASELAMLSPLTAAEVEKLMPTKADKRRLQELLHIVHSSAAQNKKVAALVNNIGELGGVVVKLLSRFLRPV